MQIRMFPITLILSLFLIIPSGDSNAAMSHRTGSERGFWSDRAVVIARIVEIDPKKLTLVLEVQAVAATDFLVPSTICADYPQFADSALGSVHFEKNGILLAVMYRNQDEWSIEHNALDFMPHKAAALVVKDMDDPAIAPILATVRQLRGR